MTREQWAEAVSERLNAGYAITLDDLGLDDHEIERLRLDEPNPRFFVDWVARKYDLTSRDEIGIRS